jgi:hypothetical protein
MAAWVAPELVPAPARPLDVDGAVDEARDLAARAREARTELERLEAELERAQAADVEAAARKIRDGSAPGSPPPAIAKARSQVELAARNAAALDLAVEAARADLTAALAEAADTWLHALDDLADEARARGLDALDALTAAAAELGQAASAGAWIRSGQADDRWDRRPPAMTIGTIAPTSRARTANGEPLRVDELLGFARELLEPPPPAARLAAAPQADVA